MAKLDERLYTENLEKMLKIAIHALNNIATSDGADTYDDAVYAIDDMIEAASTALDDIMEVAS